MSMHCRLWKARIGPAWLAALGGLVLAVGIAGCGQAPPSAPAGGGVAVEAGAQPAPKVATGPNVLVDPQAFQDLRWRSIGPSRGGRVTAVSGVRTQPNVFYAGAVGGGVWKSDDYGITWWPTTDGQIETGSIGSIAVSDSNPDVIYVGTGSQAIRSNVILGLGAYKSTDAGKTWAFIGLRNTGQIGSTRVHPTNPDIAYMAALGNPFAFGPDRGVYRTKDGGKTWQKVLFINDETGVVSLAMNWKNPNEIYAGAWRGQRTGWTFISAGPAATGGIYKTTDGGDTWTHLSEGLPQSQIGKVWLDIAQSNPKVVYALLEAPGPEGGLYRSDDSGATWKLASNEQRLRNRPFYFNYVFANPKNENEVWVHELGLHKSTDGGKTWVDVEVPHGDNHGMWFNPDNPDIIVQANDGGVNVTQNAAKTWSSILNQPTGEYYMVDTDEQFPYRVYGPQQDNSTMIVMSVPAFFWPLDHPSQSWLAGPGCESGQIRPTPDGRFVYGDCKGELGRYDIQTGQEQGRWLYPQQRYGFNAKDMKYRFVRQAPVEVDPRNPNIVYHGSQYLHKTTDGGLNWQVISPDLTANEPDKQVVTAGGITRDATGEEVYSALYAIRASRSESGVIWTGSNDGPVWVTRDGGKNWKNVTPKDLPPGGRVHTIEDSPHRKGSAYVSVYRIYLGDFKPYLYMTNDYGETWTLLTDGTNGIPGDYPMHVVREDPVQEGLLYAGTWFAAYVSFDQGKHWQSFQLNLPETPVTDIKVHHDDVVISTMGRSFWVMDAVGPLRQLAAGVAQAGGGKVMATPFDKTAKAFLFKPADAFRFQISSPYGGAYEPTAGVPGWPEYPVRAARIDYVLQNPPAGAIKIEILDATGKVLRTFSSEAPAAAAGAAGRRGGSAVLPKKAGMNRFLWDLRHVGAWSPSNPEGGAGGPFVPPGTYAVRLTAEGITVTQPLTLKMDPRVTKAGVTQADLVEQADFLLKVRDADSEAQKLADSIRQALAGKTGDQARLQALYDKLVNKPGPYPENELLSQVANIASMASRGDGRPGAAAYEYFTEVTKQLAALKADAGRVLPAGAK
jgi:photosystem II stability/assembly factor-like uncharacterized protein